MSCKDLVATEARYHYSFNKRFTAVFPKVTKQSTRTGRLVEEECNDVFILHCEWLEKEAKPNSLNEHREKMTALNGTDNVYVRKWL